MNEQQADHPQTTDQQAGPIEPTDLIDPAAGPDTQLAAGLHQQSGEIVGQIAERCRQLEQWHSQTTEALKAYHNDLAGQREQIEQSRQEAQREQARLDELQNQVQTDQQTLAAERQQLQQAQSEFEQHRQQIEQQLEQDRSKLDQQRQELARSRQQLDDEWLSLSRLRHAQDALATALEAERDRQSERSALKLVEGTTAPQQDDAQGDHKPADNTADNDAGQSDMAQAA